MAETPFRYRFIVAGALLTAFAFFWGIRELNLLSQYTFILGLLGIDAVSRMPFVDFHAILSAAECYRKGVDVYTSNPCDVFGRVHIYSPLWLTLIPSWLDTADTCWTGATLVILFMFSLAWLCPARTAREFWIYLGLCCSSAVGLAIERANIDIVVFMLMLVAGKAFFRPKIRAVSYGAILLAAALKFYPFAALTALLADTPRRAFLVGGLAVVGAISFALLWHREIALAIQHFPAGYWSGTFSAQNLIKTPLAAFHRLQFLEPYATILTSVLILLSAAAAAILAIFLGSRGVRLTLGTEETVLFLGGGAMIVACFFTGHNIHYRAILLLLTVPLLFEWTRDDHRIVRLIGWIGVVLVTFAVFENFLGLNLLNIAKAITDHYYRPVWVFWALKESAWWTLITGLVMAIYLIAWDLPAGGWLLRLLLHHKHRPWPQKIPDSQQGATVAGRLSHYG